MLPTAWLALATLLLTSSVAGIQAACTPDVDCPLFNATTPCSQAVKFDPVTKKPYLLPTGLPALIAAKCPAVCKGISNCKVSSGAEATFKCDSVACSSAKKPLVAELCSAVPSCGAALIASIAEVEKAGQCSCCVEAICGCIPNTKTVASLTRIQAQDPTGYHNPVQCTGAIPTGPPPGNGLFKGKNVILFLTDQERATMNFPPGWEQQNLPAMTRLKKNGFSFNRSYTSTCMCAPARASLLSGTYPAQHGVRYVLETDMPPENFPQVNMPTSIAGLAQVALAAGYSAVYKGKLHLTAPGGPNNTFLPSDAGQYGWSRWNPPDDGGNQALCEGGGNTGPDSWPNGNASCGNADERYLQDAGAVEQGLEGVLAYLRNVAAAPGRTQPFFLVASFINPHDVLMYPASFNNTGYPASYLTGSIGLPPTVNDTLLTKPRCQAEFTALVDLGGPMHSVAMRTEYINFYGNLIKKMDSYLQTILDTMDSLGLTDDTVVIRTADHGEMGLSHGAQKQKMFNMYKESLTVPLIFSNPKIFPSPQSSEALVTHVDFVPTMANLLGLDASYTEVKGKVWAGVDYSPVITGAAASVQDYVAFTYDDFQWGQAKGPRVQEPNHITAVVEPRWKLGKYYTMAAVVDTNGFDPLNPTRLPAPVIQTATEWEMYDTLTDPNEAVNLAWRGYNRTAEQEAQLQRLKAKLKVIEATRLRSLLFTYPVEMSGKLCLNAAPGAAGVTSYQGGLSGVPTGNGTVILTEYQGKPISLAVLSPIGRITAHVYNSTTAALAGGAVQVTSAAVFDKGDGVFGWFGPAISGSATLSYVRPPPSNKCPPVFLMETCWFTASCPGSFKLVGSATY